MDIYYPDIWYETKHLNLKTKTKILNTSKPFSFDSWWVDVLDCNKSFARQKIQMKWTDIINMLDNKSHFVVVYRRGYESWKKFDDYTWVLELGFSTYHSPTYFLWVYVQEKYKDLLIKNFKLKERK